ncbi:MAG: hypothetical protein GSR73_04145 [Desulfurococcales archaeon]|nr:hypothetical protein [Desulfurococcales archaeon]
MPTVHISLPSKVYEELKKKAGELGIQVTDLIKLYIRNGLEGGMTSKKLEADIASLETRVKMLEETVKQLRKALLRIEGRNKEALEYYNYLNERIDLLEEMIVPIAQARSTQRS